MSNPPERRWLERREAAAAVLRLRRRRMRVGSCLLIACGAGFRGPGTAPERNPTASSMVSPVVSRSTASAAGLSGAAARPASRASRSRMSRKRLSMVTGVSFCDQLLMPALARSSALAVRNTLSMRIGKDHGAHVAAVGDQARRPAERPLAVERAPAAPRVHRDRGGDGADGSRAGWHRSRRAHRGARGRHRSATSRSAARPRERALVVRGRVPSAAPSAPPAGRARRCRGSGTRAPRATPAAIVPLPEAAGPSIGDHRRAASVRSRSRASAGARASANASK